MTAPFKILGYLLFNLTLWFDHCHHAGKSVNLTWYEKIPHYKSNGSKHSKI